MVGVQELLRIRVVKFFKRIMRTDPGWKLTTVQHLLLVAEGVTKSTIYRIIARGGLLRVVEDFFGLLSTRVYEGNWVAKNVEALKAMNK